MNRSKKWIGEEVLRLRRLWNGYWAARLIITANNLDIFEHLKNGKAKTAPDVAKRIKADPRAAEILLDALAGFGLLRKSARGKLYANTPEGDIFFTRGSAYYQGDILRHADSLWKSWSMLDEVARTGKPVPRPKTDIKPFIMGMHNIAVLKAPAVIGAIGGLKGVRSALDLGGGPGTYATEMLRQGAGSVTLFDLPETVAIAKRLARKTGAKGMRFAAGDYHRDPIEGGHDLIFLSNILHACSPDECRGLVRKAKGALLPGGRAVIHDFYLADSKISPPQAALFSINMLINTPGGRCYSVAEYKNFLREAGFKRLRVVTPGSAAADSIIVEGRL